MMHDLPSTAPIEWRPVFLRSAVTPAQLAETARITLAGEITPQEEVFNRCVDVINDRLHQLARDFGLHRQFTADFHFEDGLGHEDFDIVRLLNIHFHNAGWKLTLLETYRRPQLGSDYTILRYQVTAH